MFLKEFKNHSKTLFKPFIQGIMTLIGDQVFGSLSAIHERRDPFNMQIFQIMGTLVCNEDIDLEKRHQYTC